MCKHWCKHLCKPCVNMCVHMCVNMCEHVCKHMCKHVCIFAYLERLSAEKANWAERTDALKWATKNKPKDPKSCELGANAKFWNPLTTPCGVLNNGGEKRKEFPMAPMGVLAWKHVKTRENTWKHLKTLENTWKHLKTLEDNWKTLKNLEKSWTILKILE